MILIRGGQKMYFSDKEGAKTIAPCRAWEEKQRCGT